MEFPRFNILPSDGLVSKWETRIPSRGGAWRQAWPAVQEVKIRGVAGTLLRTKG
jgi:hypothetical protein